MPLGKAGKYLAGAVVAMCSFLSGCTVGRRHTTDVELKTRFFRHRQEFEELLRYAEQDKDLETIQLKSVVYAGHPFEFREPGVQIQLGRLGLDSQRLLKYEQLLRVLRLDGGVMKRGGEVEFRADQGSFTNGDSYKGYVFRRTPPARLHTELDSYGGADLDKTDSGDWSSYSPLTSNWYLYLFVNH